MAKINYQYEEPQRPLPGESRGFRLFLLFTIVAAVTGGLIYLVIPHNQESTPEKTQAEVTESNSEFTQLPPETLAPPPSAKKTQPATEKIPETSKTNTDQEAELESTSSANVNPAEEVTTLPQDVTPPHSSETIALPKGKITPQDPIDPGPAIAAPGADDAAWQSKLDQAEQHFKAKNYAKSAQMAYEVYRNTTTNSALNRQAGLLLGQANFQAVNSGENPATLKLQIYRVNPGDNLSRLAQRHSTTIEALRYFNHLKSSNLIQVGQKLDMLSGPWQIKVEKKSRLLKLYNLSQKAPILFGFYEVGIGRFGRTPSADFVISARLRHPEWRTSDGRVFAHGDPENQLGDYFLKLATPTQADRPLRGYGIHGTPDESTVTKSLSNGCVRMRNADVKKLYYLVPIKTPVGITE